MANLTKKLFFLVSTIFFLLSAAPAFAVSDPPLFSCELPVGTLVSSYDQGVHGIPGKTKTYTGSDRVYRVDESHVLQCFCPANGGEGIQSNWWSIGELDAADRGFFERRGWVFVPTGSIWGLQDTAYLVKNDPTSCGNNGRGGGGEVENDSVSINMPSIWTPPSNTTALAATGQSDRIVALLFTGVALAWVTFRLARE